MQYSILNAKNSLPSTEELVELYDAVGWSAYTRTPERLAPMLAGSRYLYVARENTAEGADVLGVVAIFSYQLPKADKNFADADVKLVTLSNYSELIHLAQEEGYITPEGLDLLKRFKEDQENWQNA